MKFKIEKIVQTHKLFENILDKNSLDKVTGNDFF